MMNHSWARSLSNVAAAYIPFAGWAVSAYLSGYDVYLQGGGQRDIKKAWLVSVGTAAAFYGVGSATEIVGEVYGEGVAYAFNIAGHAAVGCASASAGGGSCGQGALSAGFGAAAGIIDTGNKFGNFVVAVVAGGIGAELGGGKFQNGAVSAAFGYLYNQGLHEEERPEYRSEPKHNGQNPNATREPDDAANVYRTAVKIKDGVYLGRNADGTIYRYHSDNAGTVHFARTITMDEARKFGSAQLVRSWQNADKAEARASTQLPPNGSAAVLEESKKMLSPKRMKY